MLIPPPLPEHAHEARQLDDSFGRLRAARRAVVAAAALRYRLLPPVWDLHRGNAALIYTKLAINMHGKDFDERQELFAKWLELPAAELPLEEIRVALDSQNWFDDIELAAHSNQCDWQLPLGERPLITLLLPEVQNSRALARYLAVRARWQVAQGDLDGALRTFQDGLALGQHVATGSTLIHGLVGIAISHVMFKALHDFIEHPQSPNLYWALTALPSPLIDLRKAADVESAMLYLSYPELRALHSGDHTPRDWQAIMDRVLADLQPLQRSSGPALNRLVLTGLALKAYPEAKQRLIERGRPAREVDTMPVFEVVAIDALSTYDELRDRTMCWFYFPYWQARPHLDAAEQYLATTGRLRETIPLASLLMPAIRSVSLAQARADREVAVLRVIEALSMDAAAHEGRLPRQLADITEVPLPIDPVTGKSFEYSLSAEGAVLLSPPSEAPPESIYRLRYELRLKK
jgi:hypothetical protein